MGNGFGSLYIGASGLQNAQYALNTTANNLANVNTTGYVRQQVRFADKNYNKLKDPNKKGYFLRQILSAGEWTQGILYFFL